jgi:hypothetical protein
MLAQLAHSRDDLASLQKRILCGKWSPHDVTLASDRQFHPARAQWNAHYGQ